MKISAIIACSATAVTVSIACSFCVYNTNVHVQIPQSRNTTDAIPSLSCDDLLRDNDWTASTSLTVVDNGDSGYFTIDQYADNMECFIDFGSQCNENGADVEFTHLSVQDDFTYDNYAYATPKPYVQECSTDAVKFAYKASDGTQMFTDDTCGCMHDHDNDDIMQTSDTMSHYSCDYRSYPDIYYFYFAHPADQLTETLLGTDLKFIFTSDFEGSGGKVSVKWQCATPPKTTTTRSTTTTIITTTSTTVPPTASNTLEMAAALMTGAFSPSKAVDYGCTGRGEFDAFAQSLGRPVDEVDHAFFEWKKCVQCASDGKKTAIGAYDYDITNDSCGEFNIQLDKK
jgi:hypothetical protein